MAEPEYMSLGEAAEELGVDRRRLRVLMEKRGIKTIDDPLDFRRRLIARTDVEQLSAYIAAAKKAAA